MATRKESAIDECSYEDFEPFCKWQRQEEVDLLELHLPDFKKEELKVQIIRNDILVITGERRVSNEVGSRFRKEIKICKNTKKDGIHAKFVKAGILYVSLPKNTKTLPSTYICGLQSSNSTININAKLALQAGSILLATAFGAFMYKYCFCIPIQS